ncbi:uncharacterized protein [Nicotiana tomentosiformis]|uniref:uncharacterized protein n=1 Tax=Nicotiana tomentosiformis TaxID=4098 RepID=UPI00388CD600
MRPLPLGEEEVPKPTKDKKRRRASHPDTPKPRKSRARKSKTDPAVLSADVVQMLRDEEEEGEDADFLLVARKRGGIEASRTAEPVTVEKVHPQTEVISEQGPSRVSESSGVDNASCHGEQLTGVPEGSSAEALQREENASSDSLGAINIDDSPPVPTYSEGQFWDARSMSTPDVGTSPEGDDIFRGYFMGVDDVPDLDASLIFEEAQRLLNQVTALHREESSKYRAELARCEADLKKFTEERDALKLLYVQQKSALVEQLRKEVKMKDVETLGWKHNMDRLASEKDAVRAQLSLVECQLQSVKGENLARAQKVEELKTRLAAELARATSKAEALVASYRADGEAANTWAKEISEVAEVRLFRVAEHVRHQSRRETLEEVHACGFDLTADIESAKVLEDEDGALLSDDEDSASRSESGGDEDETPEDAAPEAD